MLVAPRRPRGADGARAADRDQRAGAQRRERSRGIDRRRERRRAASDATALPGPVSLGAAAVAAVAGASATCRRCPAERRLDAASRERGQRVRRRAGTRCGRLCARQRGHPGAHRVHRHRGFALRLAGRIAAFGYGAGDASALIELAAVDSTLDPLLLLFEVGPGEAFDIDSIAILHAGIEYRLARGRARERRRTHRRGDALLLDVPLQPDRGSRARYRAPARPRPRTPPQPPRRLSRVAPRRTPTLAHVTATQPPQPHRPA